MQAPTVERSKKNARTRARRLSAKLDVELVQIYEKPIEDWDMDELARGRPRAVNGTWVGKTPGWLTPAIRNEAQKRFAEMARTQLSGHLEACIAVVADLATCEDVDERGNYIVSPSVRLSAATYVIDQILGKATAKIEHDVTDKFSGFLAGAMVMDDSGVDAHPVIEGTVVEHGEDDVSGD